MRLPLVRLTVRRLMGTVAVVAMLLATYDAVTMSQRAAKYRKRAAWYERMEKRCRQIDALDPVTRALEAKDAWDLEHVYMTDPGLNRRMITYYGNLMKKYEYAALHPRLPVAPDPIPR